jgi:hypothetical protein
MKATQFLFFTFVACTEGKTLRHVLSNEPDQSCGVTGFSYYNQSSNSVLPFPELSDPNRNKAKLLLDTLKNGEINIIANVGPSCTNEQVKCVKLKLGDFAERKELYAPYTLYGDTPNGSIFTGKPSKTGWQDLEAWTYTDSNCTLGEGGYKNMSLQLIPRTTQTVRSSMVTAVHIGTTATNFTFRDFNEMSNATCDFLKNYVSCGLVYKSWISVSSVVCKRSAIKNIPPPLQISYKIVATFKHSPELSKYANRDIPTSIELTDSISKVLTGEKRGSACLGGITMLDYFLIAKKIRPTNVFYPTTEIQAINELPLI